MRSIWMTLMLIIPLLGPVSLKGQLVTDECPELKRIIEIKAKPIWARTPEEERLRIELPANCVVKLFWPGVFVQTPPSDRPVVRADYTRVPRSPYVDNGVIHISVEYWELVERYCLLMAHDIYTRHHPIYSETPLLDHPYEFSRLVSIMQPASAYVASEAFSEVERRVNCTNPDCRRVFSILLSSAELFVLGHELAHEYYHDGKRGARPRTKEIEMRADQKACALLDNTMTQFSGDAADVVKLAFYSAPILLLQYAQENSANGKGTLDLDGFVQERIKWLKSRIPILSEYDVEKLTEYRDVDFSGPGQMQIEGLQKADLIILDDVVFSPKEVAGTLTLKEGEHYLFARAENSFAYTRVWISSAEKALPVLAYRPLQPTPAVRPPEPNAEDFEKRLQQWFDVLLVTSDRGLQPRSRAVSWLHWEALQRLNLSSFIVLDPSIPLAQSLDARLTSAANLAAPLGGWGLFRPPSDPQTLPKREGVAQCAALSAPARELLKDDDAADSCLDVVDTTDVWHKNDPQAGVEFEYRYRNTCTRPITCAIDVRSGEASRFGDDGKDKFTIYASKAYACSLPTDAEKWIIGALPWDRKADTMPSLRTDMKCVFQDKNPSK